METVVLYLIVFLVIMVVRGFGRIGSAGNPASVVYVITFQASELAFWFFAGVALGQFCGQGVWDAVRDMTLLMLLMALFFSISGFRFTGLLTEPKSEL